jgi:hypothetical protein
MKALLVAVASVAVSVPLAAQWLKQPTKGIPRTPDGKPNLSAPAPRTPDGKPDLSGLWNRISPKYSRNIAADLKPEDIQPWAQALVEQRKEDLGRDYMNVHCVPMGPSYATSADTTGAEMMKIIQSPTSSSSSIRISPIARSSSTAAPWKLILTQRGWDIRWDVGTETHWLSRVSDLMTARGWIMMAIPIAKRCA